MKTQSLSFIILTAFCLAIFSIACKELKNPETESGEATPVNPQDAVSLIYNNLEEIDGTTDVELTAEQRDAFHSELNSEIEKNGISQSTDLTEAMGILTISSMKTIEVVNSAMNDADKWNDLEKMDILENILASQAEFLKGKVADDLAISALEKMSQSAVDNMNLLTLESPSNPEITQKLASSLVKSFGKSSISGNGVEKAASSAVEYMISQSKKQDLDENDRMGIFNAALKGGTEGLADAGLNADDYKKAIATLVKSATKEATINEISAGKSNEELMASVDDITNEALNAMIAAGVPTTVCSEISGDIISGTAEGLSAVLSADELSDALEAGVDGIVNGLTQVEAPEEETASAVKSGREAAKEATDNAIIPSGVELRIGDQKLSTTEGSEEKGSFTVSLDKAPVDPVVVNIISRDATEGIVSPTELTLNAENWNKPQKIIIYPQDDWIIDDEISYNIILKANGKLNKTLIAKNADNDVAGIKVTPSKTQYSSEVGGEVHYEVRLTSQPKGPIMLRWAVTSGKESIIFNPEYREMTFPVNHAGSPHIIKIKGKFCSELEHSSVTIKSQNIISVDDKDTDYPELTPTSISFNHLKGGPMIKTTDFSADNQVKVNFDPAYLDFSDPDDEYIYETVFETESIDFTYARYQSRPLLIKESECFNGNAVDLNVNSTPATPPDTGFNYSFTFCLKFYNADLTQTNAGTSEWATGSGFSRTSCSSIGSRYVRCNFSGSGNSLPNSKVPMNTIFSGTNSEKIGNAEYNLLGGSGYYSSPPSIPEQTNQPTVNLKYKKLSIRGTKSAYFISESNLSSGFWYLSNKSKSFVLGGNTYSDSNYFYIYVP